MLTGAGCGGGETRETISGSGPFPKVRQTIIRDADEASREVAIDLVVDATTSMEGYAGRETGYGRFLDRLESSLGTKWQSADVRYFRFGTRVDSIGRDVFRSAWEGPAFYRVSGLFERTNLDSVLSRIAPDRVTVVVTDLFQDDGDTNALVEALRDRAFKRGFAVGVVPVESAYNGRVYDAPGGPYSYASTPGDVATYRPFYALVMGEAPLLRRFFETIRTVEGVRPERMLLVSPYVVSAYEVAVEKPGQTQGINANGKIGSAYRFVVRSGHDGGTLKGRLTYALRADAAPVVPDRLVMRAFRADGADSVATSEITMRNAHADGDAVAFDLDVRLTQPKGRYAYLLLFEAGDLDGQRMPEWVYSLSSDSPTATTHANKTLNLERFVAGLTQAAATVRPPRLAEVVLHLTRQ
jgi:hypothetical protein